MATQQASGQAAQIATPNRFDEPDQVTEIEIGFAQGDAVSLNGKAMSPATLLAALFSATGILGGYLIGVVFIGVDEGAFWSQMQASVDFRYDVWSGIVKSFVFGIAVSLIAVFEGYDAQPTAEGVSSSIKSTVVKSALAILALDFVLTSFMFREA